MLTLKRCLKYISYHPVQNINLKLALPLFLAFNYGFSQIVVTSKQEIPNALEAKKQMHENSIVKNIKLKNIGPTIISSRVVDIDVNPEKPTEFYVV